MTQLHWADMYAEKIIRERQKEESEHYTCASGITPSGVVHIGNFREIISVELVVRALREKQANPRFVFSWDNFDVFRKVPANIPDAEGFEKYLRMPITDIPDPWGKEESYAAANEKAIENLLSQFGIHPHYIYQAQAYRAGNYAEGIRKAIENREEIRGILNKYRNSPLEEDWWPISVFSSFNQKDNTRIKSWDGEWGIRYVCDDTGQEEQIDIRESKLIKLLWRIDWPMRWNHEKVVFEPAGKDHHSHGGSFDTARDIVKVVYDYESPVTFQYGFVQVKGGTGKLSSSRGEVISVADMLEIYQAEIIRYLFAGTRPNAEFAISFDLDVIKIYEDYDRCERIYYGKEEVSEARKEKESRIYELSQTHEVAKDMPLQLPIRHLCNLLQIYAGKFEAVLDMLIHQLGKELIEENRARIQTRMQCAWNWIQDFAPEDFRFSLQDIETLERAKDATLSSTKENIAETESEIKAIVALKELLDISWKELSDKDINAAIYEAARIANIDPKDFFTTLYRRIVGKEKGPRLGSFFNILGKDLVFKYLV